MEEKEKQQIFCMLVTTFTDLGRSVKANSRDQKLNPGEFALVNTVSITDLENKGIKISKISRKLQVAQPTITPMLRNLEKKGYIERIMDKSDRRVVLIRVTKAGKQAKEELMLNYQDHLEDLVNRMGKERILQMVSLIQEATRCFCKEETDPKLELDKGKIS